MERNEAGLARRWAALVEAGQTLCRGITFLTGLLFRAAPRLAVVLLLFTLLQAALPVANVRLTQLIVNALAAGQGAAVLVVPLAIYVTLHLAAAGFTPALNAVQALIHERLIGHVTLLTLSRVNRFTDLSRFEDPALYNDLRTICEKVPYLPRGLLQNGSYLAGMLVTATGLCLLLATLHPLIPLALVIATVPALVMYRQSSVLYYGGHLELEELERRQFYWLGLGLGAGAAREVQLYGIAGWVRDQFGRCFRELDERRWRLRRRLLGRTLAALGLRFVGTGGAFVYLLARAASGQLRPGDFVLFLGSFLMLENTLDGLPFFVASIVERSRLIDRFLAFLRPLETGSRDLLPAGALRRGIELQHVAFRYPGREESVLQDVSFHIRPGETVALVGKNGAGKTTLVKLLTGLYRPARGRILVDGRDLSDYEPASVRAQVAVVFQDFSRYFLTVGENIGLGRVEAISDRPRIERAARDGGAEPLIQRLADGCETRLGKEFGGTELSGGEWQKLALSRAFMRDADLLILDEPTASLDVRAEAEIYQRFHTLLGGRSGLLISHRFSTVRMADRIVVLDEGRIVEEGRHDNLLVRGGLYAEMFRLQAAAFQSGEEEEAQ